MCEEISLECLVTSRVSAPCSQCGQYDDFVHVIDSRDFRCESCCPIHNTVTIQEPLTIHTTRGRREQLFNEEI